MELRTLTIHNIASIGDARIDFSGPELGDASIFLISGETGAGKSTILDAISLALFEKSPRMVSSFREEIASFDSEDKKYFTNDTSQLLRRGTGEGFVKLTFLGNDSREYEAIWEIQRDYKKADRKLQKPRRTLIASDGSFTECNKRPIEVKIQEIIGLDYDQFCRTVMLAQGEFTKFLKSSKNEKSEILEKLTGTEIYSKLGREIAETYIEKKTLWELLNREIEQTNLLNDEELATLNKYLESTKAKLNNEIKIYDLLRIKFDWLHSYNTSAAQMLKLETKKQDFENIINSDKFKSTTKLIDNFKISGLARELYIEKKNLESLIEKKNSLAIKCKKKLEQDILKETEQLQVLNAHHKETESVASEYLALDLPGLNKALNTMTARDSNYGTLSTLLVKYQMAEKSVSEIIEDIVRLNRMIEEYDLSIKNLSASIDSLSPLLESLNQNLNKMEMSVSQAAREIRSTLDSGDICPVCGQLVRNALNEEMFDSILTPLREEKNKVQQEFNSLISTRMANEKNKLNAMGQLLRQSEKEKFIKKESAKLAEECDTFVKKLELNGIPFENLQSRLESIRESLKEKIRETQEKQLKAEKVGERLQNLQKYEIILKQETEKVSKRREQSELAIKECQNEIKLFTNRLSEIKRTLHEFHISHTDITEEDVMLLLTFKENDIQKCEKDVNQRLEEYNHIIGAINHLTAHMESLKMHRPEIENEITEDSICLQMKECEKTIGESNQEIGQIQHRLEQDKKVRKGLQEKLLKEKEIRLEMERWNGLYNILGDRDGARFRSVAQSFILNSLLDNANYYMSNFTDRYTLTCNPGSLAILVVDCFKPGDPQPASILSGGESFMASLSLALALSNLNSRGVAFDILFIDEGFGTLSPEYLGKVMDTLEKLHQIGGKKVGLISHVPEMKERIPVHIEVHRESPSLSKIAIECF